VQNSAVQCSAGVLYQELSVEVGGVDDVQVDGVDLLEAHHHEVLQHLAADAARAHHQHVTAVDGRGVL
jgi:hypothetical protein